MMRSLSWCVAVLLLATARARSLEEHVDVVDVTGVHVDMDGRSPTQLNSTRYVVQAEADQYAPEVSLPGLGSVRGIITESDQKKKPIYSYLGIPYAEAPVGELRFVAPVAKKAWTGVLDATKPGNICYQGISTVALRKRRGLTDVPQDLRQDEDCLLVNVHTPKVDATAKLPVLVFIHGGIFLNGNANIKTPGGLLDEADILLVSPQYRLGAFGGLNLQIDEVPGNAGLLDLIEVLKWVQKNIEHFGGDPSKVTVGGHSAGAALSSVLYLSPLSKGLIHGVFPMSGSALGFWAYDEAPEAASKSIAIFAGCNPDKEQFVKCLREAPPMALVQAQGLFQLTELKDGSLGLSGVIPSKQKAGAVKALTENPDSILASSTFTPLPYMTGVTKHEGTYPLSILEKGYINPRKLEYNTTFARNELIHVLLNVIALDDAAGYAADSSVEAYFDYKTLGNYADMRDGVIDMLGALGFKSSARKIVERNSVLGQPSFLYAFNYNGELTRDNPLGIYHGADQPYLFPSGDKFTGHDLDVAVALRKLVANFVVYQNPSPSAVEVGGASITWPAFERDSEHFLELVWPPATRQWFRSQITLARRENFSGRGSSSDSGVTTRSGDNENETTTTGASGAASSASLSAAAAVALVALGGLRGL